MKSNKNKMEMKSNKLSSGAVVLLILLATLTFISSTTTALHEVDEITIPYMVPHNAVSGPEYQLPDYGLWAAENTIYQHKWVAGDEIDGGLHFSMQLIPVEFEFDVDKDEPAEFDYIVHIRAVADTSYRVWSPWFKRELPVGVQSVDLRMTYDATSSNDHNKFSKITGVSGDVDIHEGNSLSTARYYYPEDNNLWWSLLPRDPPDGFSYIDDFDTFVNAYFEEHTFSEKARKAVLHAMGTGVSFALSGGITGSGPWPELLFTTLGFSIPFLIPSIDPVMVVEAGYLEGEYVRQWTVPGAPHTPRTGGNNNDMDTDDWLHSVRDTYYYVTSTVPRDEVNSGFTLRGGVQFAEFWTDFNIDPWDMAGVIDLHVKPDMFTRWNTPPGANPKQPEPVHSTTPNHADVGQDVVFDIDGPAYDFEGNTIRYKWDFGDGTVSSWLWNPRIMRSYNTVGIFYPKLILDDFNHVYYKIIDRHEYPQGQPWEDRTLLQITIGPAADPTIDPIQSSYGWYTAPPNTSPDRVMINVDFIANSYSYLDYATYQIIYGDGSGPEGYDDGYGKSAIYTIFDTPCAQYTTDWPIEWEKLDEGYNYLNIYVYTTTGKSNSLWYTDPGGVTIRKDTVPPTAPTLSSPNDGATSSIGGASTVIGFSWNAASDVGSGVSQYHLQIDDSSSFGSPNYNLYSAGTSNSQTLGLGTWYWRVRARDYAGNWGSFSSSRSLTIQEEEDPPPSNGCFAAGTLIATPEGEARIEDIRDGDIVFTYNFVTGDIEPNTVLSTTVHENHPGYILVNDRLRITENHPIYTDRGFVTAGKLRTGDLMITLSGTELVTDMVHIPVLLPVYNLKVEGNHNYFAEGVLVHNKVLNGYDNGGVPYCPYVYVWDGNNYTEDNNIIPNSGNYLRPELDVTDYYRLSKDLAPKDDYYSLYIVEKNRDKSFFNRMELLAVDYDAENAHLCVTPSGDDIFTVTPSISPIACYNLSGVDFLPEILDDDGLYFENQYDEHTLEFQLPELQNATDLKVLVKHRKIPLEELSHVPLDPRLYKNKHRGRCIHVLVCDENGEWLNVAEISSRMNWAYDGANISEYLPDVARTGKIRLRMSAFHQIDYVAFDTTPSEPLEIHRLSPFYSGYYWETENNLVDKLMHMDDEYMRLKAGQQFEVRFPYIPQQRAHREFILASTGHYYYDAPIEAFSPVTVSVTQLSGDGVELSLMERFDASDTRVIYGTEVADKAAFGFERIADTKYELKVDAANSIDVVLLKLDISSVGHTERMLLRIGGGDIAYYDLNEVLWRVTGISFDYYSGNVTITRNRSVFFRPSQSLINYTALSGYNVSWDFNDGSLSHDLWPMHEFTSIGTHKVECTASVMHAIPGQLAPKYTGWTFVTVIPAPPIPVIELSQTVELSLTVMGRKDNAVGVRVYEDGILIHSADVTRTPGQPDTVTLEFNRYLGRLYEIELVYDATQKGANPTWLEFSSGDESLTHFKEFNTRDGFSQAITVPASYLEDVVADNPAFHFDASGSYDIDGEIVSYEWDFGDGHTAQGIMAEHIYSAPGTYEVMLTVTDDDGLATVKTVTIICAVPAPVQPYPRLTPRP